MFNFHNLMEMNFPFNATYNVQLRCFSAAMVGNDKGSEINRGGKIILPQSALDLLTRLHIQYPMLFKLSNKGKNRISHCGVLEFSADEGLCYMPYWMMKNLLLNEGDLINIEYTNLEIAKFVKFQPQSVDFLEITNPKAVLENALRNFATLTKDDVVSIFYNDKEYEIRVLETRPGTAVSIIECDMDVDFAPPVGYVEPTNQKNFQKQPETSQSQIKYPIKKETKPIGGEGYRLDGKAKKPEQLIQSKNVEKKDENIAHERGIPNYDYIIGTLTFNRNLLKKEEAQKKDENSKITETKGYRLKENNQSTSKKL